MSSWVCHASIWKLPRLANDRRKVLMTARRPVFGAFVLALFSGLALWFTFYTIYAIFTLGPARAAQQVPYLLMGGVLLAAPVALVVLIVLAAPAYLLLRRTDRITLKTVLVIGAVGGLLGRSVVIWLWGEPESNFVPFLVVILAGAGAALVWWLAWNRTEERTLRGTV
jgi:hypothetical protein